VSISILNNSKLDVIKMRQSGFIPTIDS
jgi:hypothetical protein